MKRLEYLESTNKTKCYGCGACAQICNQDAITMQSDEEGYLYPTLEEDKCTNCGLCIKVCPISNEHKLFHPSGQNALAVYAKDETLLKKSSSGGMFSVLSNAVLNRGGVVFGAAFDSSFKLKHTVAKNINELTPLRGSKYIQSNIGDTYSEAKSYLLKGRDVLFSGTPCQIAGLKSYLGKDFHNLLTCDLVCHGVPSPLLFQKYIREIEKKEKCKIDSISMRSEAWGIALRAKLNNHLYVRSSKTSGYLNAFMENKLHRPCCYECEFTKPSRVGDITLADYWGVMTIHPDMYNPKGVSLVLLNSEQGKKYFNLVKNSLTYSTTSLEQASIENANLKRPSQHHPDRDRIYSQINTVPYRYLEKRYFIPKHYQILLLKEKFKRSGLIRFIKVLLR